MVNFVLVAGAQLGAWAWDDVVPHLRAAGHDARPLTLSGLAEKRGMPAGQQTHVRDIVDEIERRDLRDVVLVGHSYAGIPVGQAAGRIGDRLRRVVFVDAEVPADGVPFVSAWPDGGAAVLKEIAEHDGHRPVAPPSHYAGHGLTDEQIARIVDGSTPHPGTTLSEPAVLPRPLAELPGTYVVCLLAGAEPSDRAAELLTGERWRRADLDTGHWPMFSRPRELAAVLLDVAEAA
ncbi:alpha/beta fold hydrolase [Streptomyces huiliensis]|uniref:alpha/beta fold hydrolase n=1 Tax=Streptomyces huiliensis TaxID=2876027 RepID=UPI001CBCCC94|nr:alpha/beta fold hydrolase [Streptomyces huiliensis]MBZ4318401.1 alpha/beta fold hydrolase [Streptomyces huiliensis]